MSYEVSNIVELSQPKKRKKKLYWRFGLLFSSMLWRLLAIELLKIVWILLSCNNSLRRVIIV